MPTSRVVLRRLRELGVEQSGGIAVYAAIAIVMLLGFVGLTIDIGRMAIVKGEMKRAADAGALAGARALNLIAPAPNWTNGATVASNTVKQNRANGSLLTDCTIQTGYWDLTWSESQKATANLKSTGILPGPNDVPAIKVTVEKITGKNGGPLAMLFGKILGVSAGCSPTPTSSSKSLSVQSVAAMVADLPLVDVPPGDAFPMATPIGWVQLMWNPNADSADFRIGSAYHDPTGGQWTSFLVDANNVPTIRNLIDNGNPTPLKIGDEIWIQPGTETNLYDYASSLIGKTMVLPIVANDFNTHDDSPILAFVPFKITDASGGSDKYIQGHFVHNYKAPGGTGSGNAPNFGAMGFNAKLVN
jgi:Flp pilus assembly protein TadG